KIVRQFRAELQIRALRWMFDTEEIGMQSLSAKGRERGSGVVGELASFGLEAAAIDRVAEERMPDRGEVDADLMRAPGLEPAGDEARHRRAIAAAVAFEHLPMGDRRAPAGAHRHFVAGAGMAADRLVDR